MVGTLLSGWIAEVEPPPVALLRNGWPPFRLVKIKVLLKELRYSGNCNQDEGDQKWSNTDVKILPKSSQTAIG